jgi:F420-dependent oxidoreductase-like protein
MRLCVFVEPQQGMTYAAQLAMAQRAEALGFDGFFRSDHFLGMGVDGLPGPTDSWVTLGALARETSRLRLGTLVTSATFRLPGPLAIAVAQVDEMSGGRVELGIGAGWFEAEHLAYGIPFPAVGERFDRLDEQLAIITGLWSDGRFSYQGRYYDIADSPGLPKPVQRPGPPVIVGGRGPRRTPALAARYADEYNMPFQPLDATRAAFERVAAACADFGRDGRAPMVYSFARTIVCGRTDDEVKRRAAAIGRDPADMGASGFAGTPAQLVEELRAYAEIGAQRAFLQILDLDDLDHLDLIAAEVAPLLTET